MPPPTDPRQDRPVSLNSSLSGRTPSLRVYASAASPSNPYLNPFGTLSPTRKDTRRRKVLHKSPKRNRLRQEAMGQPEPERQQTRAAVRVLPEGPANEGDSRARARPLRLGLANVFSKLRQPRLRGRSHPALIMPAPQAAYPLSPPMFSPWSARYGPPLLPPSPTGTNSSPGFSYQSRRYLTQSREHIGRSTPLLLTTPPTPAGTPFRGTNGKARPMQFSRFDVGITAAPNAGQHADETYCFKTGNLAFEFLDRSWRMKLLWACLWLVTGAQTLGTLVRRPRLSNRSA